MKLFWWLLPIELLPWIVLGLGLGWLLGLVRGRTLIAFAALLLAWPLIEAWLGTLPLWIQTVLLFLLLLGFVRDLLAFFIGERAADHAVGESLALMVKAIFQLLVLPFRILGWIVRRESL